MHDCLWDPPDNGGIDRLFGLNRKKNCSRGRRQYTMREGVLMAQCGGPNKV